MFFSRKATYASRSLGPVTQTEAQKQSRHTKPQEAKDSNTSATTVHINHKINSIHPNKGIVHHNSDTPSTTSVQKLSKTRTRVSKAETLPVCPKRSNTIAPDLKRRHRNRLTCRHNSLARVGIFTSEFTSQNIKFISQKLHS